MAVTFAPRPTVQRNAAERLQSLRDAFFSSIERSQSGPIAALKTIMNQIDQQTKGQGDIGKSQDPLLLDSIYKDPLAAFLHQPRPLEQLKENCLIFLDTNVLLIPYSTSKDSLKSFTDIYQTLSEQGRLYLADRVMQEFEKNVPDQLKNIFHSLVLGQNYNAPPIDFPLLEGLQEYVNLKTAEKSLRDQLQEYRKASRATLEAIERWNHNDPVRSIYRLVFSKAKRAHITSLKSDEILKAWNLRLNNKIPPGYKDSAKSDSGIGDYLLWQAVLDTCAKEKKDAIVVSSDAKPDWWHTTDNQTLYARRELVEEFRSATGGNTVRLLSPSDFLQLYGANNAIVEEVSEEQANAIELSGSSQEHTKQLRAKAISLAQEWVLSQSSGSIVGRGSSAIVLSNGSTHEFKFKHFLGHEFALRAFNEYGQEDPVAAHHTLVLVGSGVNALTRLLNRLAKREFGGVNVIVGRIFDDTFNPIFFSNARQSENLLLENDTD